jgi:hypothetical protein
MEQRGESLEVNPQNEKVSGDQYPQIIAHQNMDMRRVIARGMITQKATIRLDIIPQRVIARPDMVLLTATSQPDEHHPTTTRRKEAHGLRNVGIVTFSGESKCLENEDKKSISGTVRGSSSSTRGCQNSLHLLVPP